MRQTSKKSERISQPRTAKTQRSNSGALPIVVLPQENAAARLPAAPFSDREHVKLLYEASGLSHEDLKKVRKVLLEALEATAAKDITVSRGNNEGSEIQRVQADLANYDVRLEAAEKLLKLFDLYPKKGASVTVEKSNVMINPKFVKK